jgi:DNA-directed RNA polymerase subunit RPC12/RpoP
MTGLPPSFDPEGDRKRRAAEELYRHGREAVKAGELERARHLLQQAVDNDRNHSDAWLWLTATTKDPAVQRQYLEWAIAANPGNTAARRGLGQLAGHIPPLAAPPPPASPPAAAKPAQAPSAEPVAPAQAEQTFTCAKCGGALRFDPAGAGLRCEHCGQVVAVESHPAGEGRVLDWALPTAAGHAYASAERRYACRQCGAATVLPPGQLSGQCPYCGAGALISAPGEAGLLPVQGILPPSLDLAAAEQAVRGWLGQGAWLPSDLTQLASRQGLQPVYVPVWCLDANLTAHWRGAGPQGGGRGGPGAVTGERVFLHTGWLQPAARSLDVDLFRQAGPFDLGRLETFQPAYLAGWAAGTAEVSLADATLAAREGMLADARQQLGGPASPGAQLKHLEVTRGDFSGQAYRLVLLPLWLGSYRYRGRVYQVMVNGQTGKAAGHRPVDGAKVALAVAAAALAVALFMLLGVLVFSLLS